MKQSTCLKDSTVSTDEKLGLRPPGNHRETQVPWYSYPVTGNNYGLDWSLLNHRSSWHPNSPESRTYLMAEGLREQQSQQYFTLRDATSPTSSSWRTCAVWLDSTQSNLPALVISSLPSMDITQGTKHPLCLPSLCRFYVYTDLTMCVHNMVPSMWFMACITHLHGTSTQHLRPACWHTQSTPWHHPPAATNKLHTAQQPWVAAAPLEKGTRGCFSYTFFSCCIWTVFKD